MTQRTFKHTLNYKTPASICQHPHG